ncbi:hypothetical protein ATE84_3093 [Aquimarina sp. MAR_2010_214]|uniref:hypothetical protein n=1 Tax=Aquimarina sp. MAR_2010_214 TaxID=1250026 RepID=UPI000C708422|nr:hypothetical protein [Aquimarina sp. MAR_2010_214]PKV51024.1 hypothetical protein ATE84_3093 [Aquimarina sp. MAR_2010_214]
MHITMKNNPNKTSNFNTKTFLFACIPSYIFPAVMSWVSGWFMNNPEIMQASYTTIAIPSLIAACLSYMLLWSMEKLQFFPANKFIRTILLVIVMVLLSLITIELAYLKSEIFNILFSTILGTAITTWRQPISKIKKQS